MTCVRVCVRGMCSRPVSRVVVPHGLDERTPCERPSSTRACAVRCLWGVNALCGCVFTFSQSPGESSYTSDYRPKPLCPIHGPSREPPPQRPYIPFEGKSTTQEAYAPKYVGDDCPVFGAPSNRGGVGSEGPSSRPYIPFEGESVTKSSYPYV